MLWWQYDSMYLQLLNVLSYLPLILAEPSPAFNNNALTSDNQLEATTSVFEDAADAAGGPSDLTPHPDIINRGTPGAADTMDGIGGVRLAVPKHMGRIL